MGTKTMDSTNYFSSPGVSNSVLTEFKNTIEGKSINYGDGLRLGTLHDALITEADKLDRSCNMIGEYSYSFDEIKEFETMRDIFLMDPMCKLLHSMANFQHIDRGNANFNYMGNNFSMLCRCKWDFRFKDWGLDLKSTDCKTQKQFEEACDYFDYDRSRYFYMNIIGSTQDMLIGQSKHYPYPIFKVPISKGSPIWRKGQEKCNEIAFKYYLYMYES